ncbi:MAG TPA: lysophospholipid acyltransferase family protein, partial [Actinomycetota bacterium]|nr:lysophospholipid acyltransferase family protein [Actinomycetota bacterium]
MTWKYTGEHAGAFTGMRPRARPHASPAGWARSGPAVVVRAALRAVLLFPIVRLFCRRRIVEGAHRIPGGPVIFVANHAGHADTPLILRSLPRVQRNRLAPAAAADYFFRTRLRGALTTLIVGAFPFPRCGTAGLDRADRLMRDGWSVLLFPEGTRSPDGRIHEFKRGAARLAARRGATIVPVGIAGSREVLGKGAV